MALRYKPHPFSKDDYECFWEYLLRYKPGQPILKNNVMKDMDMTSTEFYDMVDYFSDELDQELYYECPHCHKRVEIKNDYKNNFNCPVCKNSVSVKMENIIIIYRRRGVQ